MKVNKEQKRSLLTDSNLKSVLKVRTSNLSPDFDKLVSDNSQLHHSHWHCFVTYWEMQRLSNKCFKIKFLLFHTHWCTCELIVFRTIVFGIFTKSYLGYHCKSHVWAPYFHLIQINEAHQRPKDALCGPRSKMFAHPWSRCTWYHNKYCQI